MDYIAILTEDLGKGYSKSDLEKLIGLPKNNLSGILKGDRKLSKKSELKIELWVSSEKPSPLELPRIKTEMEVAKTKIENNQNSGKRVDIENLGITDRIAQLEEKLKMPPKYLPKLQRDKVEKELNELKFKLKD